MTGNKCSRGKYFVKHKEKYRGNPSNLTYRSSWEKYVMEMLDVHPDVKWWSSEETIIPYFSNADGKRRRYFMDFTICWNNGKIQLWEVKPKKETIPPKKPSKLTSKAKQRFMNEVYNWSVNNDKWKTTVDVCNKKDWEFKIITEDALKRMGMKGLR